MMLINQITKCYNQTMIDMDKIDLATRLGSKTMEMLRKRRRKKKMRMRRMRKRIMSSMTTRGTIMRVISTLTMRTIIMEVKVIGW